MKNQLLVCLTVVTAVTSTARALNMRTIDVTYADHAQHLSSQQKKVIQDALELHWHWVSESKSYEARYLFVLTNGKVNKVHLVHSSGNARFDLAAHKAIEQTPVLNISDVLESDIYATFGG